VDEIVPHQNPPLPGDSDDEDSRPAKRWLSVRSLGLVIVIVTLVSLAITFLILTGSTTIPPTKTVVRVAMAINGILAVVLIGTIGWEILSLVRARRRGRAAARLHVRIVTLFSVIAAFPAIVVAITASITLDQGLDRWFQDRTRGIVSNALTVANAYLQEHAHVLRGDLIAMGADVDRAKQLYDYEPSRFDTFFQTQASLRLLPAAYLVGPDGKVITSAVLNPEMNVLMPPPQAISQSAVGKPVLIAPGPSNLVGGVVKLAAYEDTYLYVVRMLDPRVIEYLRLAKENADEYSQMEENRFGVQVAFGLVYIGVALVLLLVSIWIGLGFANRLVAPIRRLIGAADQISRGNLDVTLPINGREGDLARLGSTFNTMTGQLRHQRGELLAANKLIDRRRRFTEAVLSGVTAGVLGIDEGGSVTLANRSAVELLEVNEALLIGHPIEDTVPELRHIVEEARSDTSRERLEQITLLRDGRERIISVRATNERSPSEEHGIVVTLDDITDLVSAQRASAWADIARRIAHEIKNPLTPIQLSAERLRRRYGRKIEDDTAVFDQCVDTIIRQVGDIGRMVDEFSAFARMPKAAITPGDLTEAVSEAVFLQTVGNPEIEITTEFAEKPMPATFDHRLITQAVTNVVKNATEAVEAVPAEEQRPGKIHVRTYRDGDFFVVDIIDNGIGLPVESRRRLLEPYMTTRKKGTGLGLAIVGKIMEEHGGCIELLDAPAVAEGGHGAMVRLLLAAHDVNADSEDNQQRPEERSENDG